MLGELSNPWWVFILIGVFAGLMSGLLGIGGGVIMVPALIIAAGFGQKNAQGMSLAVMIPMAMLGAFRYWRNPEISVNGFVAVLIVIGALIGVMAGTELVLRLPAHTIRKLFAVIMMVIAVKMMIAPPKSSVTPATDTPRKTNQNMSPPPEMKAPAEKDSN